MTDIREPHARESGVRDLVVRVECAGDNAVVTVIGECDNDSSNRLQEAVREALNAGCRHIMMDFGLVTFLDASTVRMLLQCRRETIDRYGALTVHRLRGTPALVLDVTGTSRLLRAADDNVLARPAGPGRRRRSPDTAVERVRRPVAGAAAIVGRAAAIVSGVGLRIGAWRSCGR